MIIFHSSAIYIFFETGSVFRESISLCACHSDTASHSIARRYLAFTVKTMLLVPEGSITPLCNLFSLCWHGCVLATVVTRSLLILTIELSHWRQIMLRCSPISDTAVCLFRLCPSAATINNGLFRLGEIFPLFSHIRVWHCYLHLPIPAQGQPQSTMGYLD